MIHDDAVSAKQNPELAVPEAAVFRRKFAQPLKKTRIDLTPQAVADGAASASDNLAGALFANSVGLERPHRGFPR